MKKMICVILSVILLAVTCVYALAEEGLTGSWTAAGDPIVTEEARAAFDKAMESLVGVGYEPVALLGTQIVAGMNYCLLCKATTVTLEPRTFYALVYIYAGLNGDARLLDIQEIDMGISDACEETESQNPAMNLVGTYQDETSGRATMYISCLGEVYADVSIVWGDSASQTVEWTFTGMCSDEGDTVTYIEGEKRIFTYDEAGNETVTVVYSDGEGMLELQEDGSITWSDQKEDAGKDCRFVFCSSFGD